MRMSALRGRARPGRRKCFVAFKARNRPLFSVCRKSSDKSKEKG
jgi:hypothetical protein